MAFAPKLFLVDAFGQLLPGLKNSIIGCVPNFYRPQRSCGKVMFSQACVKNSVHGGGSLSGGGVCPGGESLSGGLCPGGVSVRENPRYGNERAVRSLLECILFCDCDCNSSRLRNRRCEWILVAS